MKGFFIVSYAILLSSFAVLKAEACTKNFKRYGDMMNFAKSCFNEAGFPDVPSNDDLSNPDFDDKCADKCVLRAFDLIDDEGHIDRDSLSDFLEENAPKPLMLKLTEIANSCADAAEGDKIKGTKLGTTSEECKPVGKFYSCFIAAADKLC